LPNQTATTPAEFSGPLPPLTLVLGGARSGKSTFAEAQIAASGAERLYLATATILDTEMEDRVRWHRDRRGSDWLTVEEPLALGDALLSYARPDRAILVDCLTLWLSNLLLADQNVDAAVRHLLSVLGDLPGPVVFVANEVGLGIVPDNALARLFRDHAGLLNQALARHCQRVVFMAAGLPLFLKDCR
jgi:adenosylcobinamide kinase/adenosylcobinamide-phosphate guanylyltransferase